jgi:hypothetical protein
VNIFINYRPACSDTEKGGRGDRDTGIITRNGVTRLVACADGEAPTRVPPHTPTALEQFSTASLDLEDGL